MRSIAPVSVAVPTVERGSALSRCDSAAIVPNTSELLPEPETPVNTVSRRFGSSTLTSLRLFTRAPCTRMRSWRSAAWAADRVSMAVVTASALLLDADQVPGGIAEGAVADPVRLVGRLLHDLRVAGLQPFEGGVEVGGGQVDAGVGALRHHLGDRAALVVGDAGVGLRRVEDDRRVGLAGRADRDPVHPAVLDVEAGLQAERVAVEGQRGLRVGMREHARMDGEVHGR